MIKVLIIGFKGNMGNQLVSTLNSDIEFKVVATVDKGDDLSEAIATTSPDVAVDLTHPDAVKHHVTTLLSAGVHAVVGTTGLSDTDMAELDQLAQSKQLGLAICPNFALGAVLMMKLATQVAEYLPRAEIIEYHHDKKADAPSGTAIITAKKIAEAHAINTTKLNETELIAGARGGAQNDIPIHSIRLPGYVACQEVIFGGLGQTLSIRHDTVSREAFMPGILIAIKKIRAHTGLVYGLDKLL